MENNIGLHSVIHTINVFIKFEILSMAAELEMWHTNQRTHHGQKTKEIDRYILLRLVDKCSPFPEHLISLPLGSSWFHQFIIYTLHNLSVLCVWINDWFVCLD